MLMKKTLTTLCVLFVSAAMYAVGLEGVRVYVNPGHGSFGPDDRPMATIPYPKLATTGMPDTCGFYESNTNLWKCQELEKKLKEAGAYVMMSRTASGPWDYVYPYSDYTFAAYSARDDYEKWNRPLAEIREEAEANNMDYFISVHSNAYTEAGTTNYLLFYVRGDGDYADSPTNPLVKTGLDMANTAWPYAFDLMGKGLEVGSHYSYTNKNVRQNNSGILRHTVPGYLVEGYFHTYQPARHRALNKDYCRDEGLRYYRGIAAWFEQAPENKGYILGAVKDMHNKMNHPLYSYTPKSHDQYVPLNGATVTLYKGGVKVADYQTDTCWNGLYFFRDLEPGADYSIDVTHPAYKPLTDEYKAPITVEANTTMYPIVYLEDTAYVPAPIVYVDYIDQAPGAVLGSRYVFENKGEKALAIEGTIKRTIGVGDSTIVLSHTEDKVAHLYLIDHLTGAVSAISTEGIVADTENAGEYLALSDIAYTSDAKLVGCNYIRCQFSDDQVDKDAGQKRGVVQFYKWEGLDSIPKKWVSSDNSSNSYRSDQGYTMGISGPTHDCYIFYSGVHTNADNTTDRGARFTELVVVNNAVVSTGYHMYNIDNSDGNPFTQSKIGDKFLLTLSPRDTKTSWVIDGNAAPAIEAQMVAAGQDLSIKGTFAEEAYGKVFTETNFVKYGGKVIAVAPYEKDGKLVGVRLYDVTDGLDKATPIKANLDLAAPIEAKFAAATLKATADDMTIYLVADNKLITFTTAGVEQPLVKGIYAYDLTVTRTGADYTFSFMATDEPIEAHLVFFDGETEVGRMAISNPVKGKNEVKITSMDLPGEEGVFMRWGVEMQGDVVIKWQSLYTETALEVSRLFSAIDNNPESDYFGRIYLMNRFNSGDHHGNIYIYNPDWTFVNTTPYYGGRTWGNPNRMAVAPDGTVFFTDWGDGASGIYLMDPAHPDGTYTGFYQGTHKSDGVFTTADGVGIGSSTAGLAFYGTGADTKLLVFNEDPCGTTLPKNGVVIYHIGQADGTLAKTWSEAPSQTHALVGLANGDGNIWPTSHGYFVAQTRYSGNNTADIPSLVFHDYEGKRLYNSGEEHSKVIDGTNGSGFLVTPDEKQLVVHDGGKQFIVMDITWDGNTPVMTLNHKFNHGMSDIRQMWLDYAGNVVASGASGLQIFAMPHQNNIVLTPAKNSLRVVKSSTLSGIEKAETEHVNVRKVLENGSIVIIQNGVRYNVMGVRL